METINYQLHTCVFNFPGNQIPQNNFENGCQKRQKEITLKKYAG